MQELEDRVMTARKNVRYISDVIEYYRRSVDLDILEKVIKAVEKEVDMSFSSMEYHSGINEMVRRLESYLLREK